MARETPAPLATWGRGHPALTRDTPSLLTLQRQPELGQGSPGGLVTGVIDTGNTQAPAHLHEHEPVVQVDHLLRQDLDAA